MSSKKFGIILFASMLLVITEKTDHGEASLNRVDKQYYALRLPGLYYLINNDN